MEESILSLDCLSLAETANTYEAEVNDEWDTDTEAEGK